MKPARRLRRPIGVGLAFLVLGLAACGGFPEITEPVGTRLLPDLVAEPPVDLRVTRLDDGTLEARFSSTLVNVGDGDFALRASRETGDWAVTQEIWYSESGAELRASSAELAFAGDGHEHWHVRRVAGYRLVPLDSSGSPVDNAPARTDAKIGFCFYDHTHSMGFGDEDPRFDVHECGEENATEIRMGLSPGWADVYGFNLPGQSIDITDLPDGAYRIWAEADAEGWFEESNKENNTTWIDFDLTTDGENRFATITQVGPEP